MPLGNSGALPFSGAEFLQGAGAALNVFNAISAFGQGKIGSGIGSTIGAAASIASLSGVAAGTAIAPFLGPAAIAAPIIGMLADSLFGKGRGTPTAAATVTYSGAQQVASSYDQDNDGDLQQAQQLLQSIDAATRAFVTATGGVTNGQFGLGVEGADGKYKVRTLSGEVASGFGSLDEAVIAGFRKNVADGLIAASDEVLQAVARSTQTDIDEFLADISLAKAIHDATAGLQDLDNSLSAITARAKESAAATYAAADEPLTRADTLGLGDRYRAILEGQIRSTFAGAVDAWTPNGNRHGGAERPDGCAGGGGQAVGPVNHGNRNPCQCRHTG